jgi:hypothetical protein
LNNPLIRLTCRNRSRRLFTPAWLVLAALAALPAAAQTDNPLTPLPPHATHRIPTETHADPAPMPPEKIIESLAVRQDDCARAHQMYGFKRSVRIQEFPHGGGQGGEVREESEVYLADNGRRYERSVHQSSQPFAAIKAEAVDSHAASQVPLFPLTSNQMKYYDLTYKGTQPLDELRTYIFEVKPKRLLPRYRLFSGLIYVDDRDLAIVKLYGKWTSQQDEDDDTQPPPFVMYEIYYENVDGKYWFPTYFRSDGYAKTKAGEDELRLVVKMTDFKVIAPAAAPGSSAPSPSPDNPPKPDKPDKPANLDKP